MEPTLDSYRNQVALLDRAGGLHDDLAHLGALLPLIHFKVIDFRHNI